MTEPYWPQSFGGGLWRPTVMVSYALDYRVSTRAQWFHLGNAVWAAIAAALLALLAAELAGPATGLATGLVFAVLTERVRFGTLEFVFLDAAACWDRLRRWRRPGSGSYKIG